MKNALGGTSLKHRTLIPGGDFSLLLIYTFYYELGKQNAEFKENLLLGLKNAPCVSSDIKKVSARKKQSPAAISQKAPQRMNNIGI